MSEQLLGADPHVRFVAYDGSSAGPADATVTLDIRSEEAIRYIATAPGRPRPRTRVRHGPARGRGRPARRPDRAAVAPRRQRGRRRGARASSLARPRCCCGARRSPPEEAAPPWRRGTRHSKRRDALAIAHHYDVSNRFYELRARPFDDLHLRALRARRRHARAGAVREVRPGRPQARPAARTCACSTSAAGGAGWSCTPPSTTACTRWESPCRAARRSGRRRRSRERGLTGLAEVRFLDYRDVPESRFDAVSWIGLTEHIGSRNLPGYVRTLASKLRPGGRLLNHCITRPQRQGARPRRRLHRPLRLPRRRARERPGPSCRRSRTTASRSGTPRTSASTTP